MRKKEVSLKIELTEEETKKLINELSKSITKTNQEPRTKPKSK